MKTQNKRAQSAVEYLMTYGWAILVIIVVGAALWKLGVFDVSKYTGSAKLAISGFTVSGSQLTTSQFKVKVGSQESVTVYDFNVTVTGATPSPIGSNEAGLTYCNVTGTSTVVGSSAGVSWSPNSEKDITCSAFSPVLTAGSTYNTKIDIYYKDASGYYYTVSSTYNPKAE